MQSFLDRAQSGDEEACSRLVEENSGLVWAIVKRYYGCGVETDDLFQLGCIGLIKAIHGFDHSFGTKFSTYAVPKIAGEIRRFLRDNGAIKVSRTLREKSQIIWSARERLTHYLGREPQLSEIAAETEMSTEEIAQVELANIEPESLQKENEEGLTLETTLAANENESSLLESLSLQSAIRTLPDKERMTILLRFYKNMTQQQSAKVLGVSQVQISRLERKAIAHLREQLQNW